jgi:serine/threonine-protein phosphatase 2B catalytic subunit
VFEREGTLEKAVCLRILKEASDLFKTEPNILALKEPVCVVGDIHGQYYDLLKVLEIGGNPNDMQYDNNLYIYILR